MSPCGAKALLFWEEFICELGTEVFGLIANDGFTCWAIVING